MTATTPAPPRRTCRLLRPDLLRITTGIGTPAELTHDYRLEVWASRRGKVIELSYTDAGVVTTYTVTPARRPEWWRCTCDAATKGQTCPGGKHPCKHKAALITGLRQAGVTL